MCASQCQKSVHLVVCTHIFGLSLQRICASASFKRCLVWSFCWPRFSFTFLLIDWLFLFDCTLKFVYSPWTGNLSTSLAVARSPAYTTTCNGFFIFADLKSQATITTIKCHSYQTSLFIFSCSSKTVPLFLFLSSSIAAQLLHFIRRSNFTLLFPFWWSGFCVFKSRCGLLYHLLGRTVENDWLFYTEHTH